MGTMIGFIGKKRHGKTLLMTLQILLDYIAGRKIITNYPVYIEKTEFNMDDMFELNNCTLALDEIHTIVDSRTPFNRTNRLVSYFASQSGKRDVDFYYSTQFNTFMDLRLRYLADIRIFCQRIGTEGDPLGFRYVARDSEDKTIGRFFLKADDARRYIYHRYDSYKVIMPLEVLKSEKRKKKELSNN